MRREFTKKTQRVALARSGGLCEAVGAWYGLDPGKRCNTPLSKGVQYDHIDLDANSKDNSLANCSAVCIRCHDHKTRHHDIPVAAKTVRQQDAARGVRQPPRKPIQSAPFPKPAKPERPAKAGLPPKQFYERTIQ